MQEGQQPGQPAGGEGGQPMPQEPMPQQPTEGGTPQA